MRGSVLRVYLPRHKRKDVVLNSRGEDLALRTVLTTVDSRAWKSDGYHFVFGAWSRFDGRRKPGDRAREADLIVVDTHADMIHFVEIKGGDGLYDGAKWRTWDRRDPFDQAEEAAVRVIDGLGRHLAAKGIGGRLAYRAFVWGPEQSRDGIKPLLDSERARAFIGMENNPLAYIRKNVRLFPPPDGDLLRLSRHLDDLLDYLDRSVFSDRLLMDGSAAVHRALAARTATADPGTEARVSAATMHSDRPEAGAWTARRRSAVFAVADIVDRALGALAGAAGGFARLVWRAFHLSIITVGMLTALYLLLSHRDGPGWPTGLGPAWQVGEGALALPVAVDGQSAPGHRTTMAPHLETARPPTYMARTAEDPS